MVVLLNQSVESSTHLIGETAKMDRKLCLRKNKVEKARLQSTLDSCARDERSSLQKLDHTISEVLVELEKLKLCRNPIQRLGHVTKDAPVSRTRGDVTLPAIAVTCADDTPDDGANDMKTLNPYPISFKKIRGKKKKTTDWWNSVIHPQGISSMPTSPRCSTNYESVRPLTPDIYCDDMNCDTCSHWVGHPHAISSVRRPRKSSLEQRSTSSFNRQRLSVSPLMVDYTASGRRSYASSFVTWDSNSGTPRSVSQLSLYSSSSSEMLHDNAIVRSRIRRKLSAGSIGLLRATSTSRRSSVCSSTESIANSCCSLKSAPGQSSRSMSDNRLSRLCVDSKTVKR